MAQPTAYRKASQGTGVWVLMCILGVVGLHAAMFTMIATKLDRAIGGWVFPIGLSPLVIGVGAGWWLVARLKAKRIGRVAVRLDALGFHATEKPTEAERAQFAAPIVHLFPSHSLQRGAVGIEWYAIERTATEAKVLLFEHEYVTGSGKTTQTHYHTMVAWPAGHPDLRAMAQLANAPWLFMARFSRLLRRAYRDRELKVPEFADLTPVWTLVGDATTATRFLTPTVRSALSMSPKTEAWSLGAGWVCCVFAGTLDGDSVERFLAHTRGVVASGGR